MPSKASQVSRVTKTGGVFRPNVKGAMAQQQVNRRGGELELVQLRARRSPWVACLIVCDARQHPWSTVPQTLCLVCSFLNFLNPRLALREGSS